MRLVLTGGEAHEAPQATALLKGFEVEQVLGDKAYDSDVILQEVDAMGAEAVIPPRVNRLEPRTFDQELYKERHLVECFIGKIKQFRRCFSRFDKLARNFLSFLQFASILIWLR